MSIPACQIHWMTFTIGLIGLTVGCFVGLAAIGKKSVKAIVRPCAIVLVIMLPFLYWTRTAVYAGKEAIGDTAIGFPLVYAYGQSDAGLGPFYKWKLIVDAGIGLAVGVMVLAADRVRRQRKAQQPNPPYSEPATRSPQG